MKKTVKEAVSIPSTKAVERERSRLQHRKKHLATLRTTVGALIVVAAMSILVSTLYMPVIRVSGSSMEPSLADNDILLLVKTSHLETGDLVGFYYENKLLLKRVIGEPGDIIDIDAEGNVTLNGELLDEPYLAEKALGETDYVYPYQVPEGQYFVMGDNRLTSIDSRSSAIGCVSTDQILGKVVLRIWPFSSIGLL